MRLLGAVLITTLGAIIITTDEATIEFLAAGATVAEEIDAIGPTMMEILVRFAEPTDDVTTVEARMVALSLIASIFASTDEQTIIEGAAPTMKGPLLDGTMGAPVLERILPDALLMTSPPLGQTVMGARLEVAERGRMLGGDALPGRTVSP